jgi:hypothetical protein
MGICGEKHMGSLEPQSPEGLSFSESQPPQNPSFHQASFVRIRRNKKSVSVFEVAVTRARYPVIGIANALALS